jgi:hypothetical protein
MNLQEVTSSLPSFSFEDLKTLNKSVVTELRSKMRERSMTESKKFSIGDQVWWISNRRQGTLNGKITRCNPKTATVMVGQALWTVPWTMLKKVE